MATCYHCGEEIEFRWIDGGRRPIHVNGGRCTGGSGSETAYSPFSYKTVYSYLNPTSCPVCDASVFFYRSPYNGRVFFDNVPWPWPKHDCTDTYQRLDDPIMRPLGSRLKTSFKNRDGK